MPVADLPAGLDPDELNAVPGTSARRGKLRRRIAFLRAAREVLLRDLGGFVYELHRTAGDIEHEAHRRLRETKLTRLSRVDAELHELEYRLDDVRRQVIVREPGVGGECPHCGELFGSAAHYCSQCGLPLTESARREQARAREPEPLPDPVVAPAPEAAALTDQPTQEIPPLDPDHPGTGEEFQWPRREGRVVDGRAVGARYATVRQRRGRAGRIGARFERERRGAERGRDGAAGRRRDARAGATGRRRSHPGGQRRAHQRRSRAPRRRAREQRRRHRRRRAAQ